jgi:FO synthase
MTPPSVAALDLEEPWAQTLSPGQTSDPLEGLGPVLKPTVSGTLEGLEPSDDEARAMASSTEGELASLCRVASLLRDRGKGHTVTFSPKVFIPLTHLCRDFCSYCTFRQSPSQSDALYMTPEEVLEVARAGEVLGCTEALFTLGERPEQRYPQARQWLNHRGFRTTLEYLKHVSSLVLKETNLLPHGNPGTMSRREMASLREVNTSMGVMLEVLSPRLTQLGGPHHRAPSKWPKVRLKTLNLAGELKIPFTTGLLIGIGETRQERIESLLAIRDSHQRHGHVQEVIIQNFRAKTNTEMEGHPNATTQDLLWTVAIARLILGPGTNLQIPPNLSPQNYPLFLLAGINDWGGVSPLTIDFVNPEAPWPNLAQLQGRTEELGFTLRPRLPVYPEYMLDKPDYLDSSLAEHVRSMADAQGYVKGGIERYAVATN